MGGGGLGCWVWVRERGRSIGGLVRMRGLLGRSGRVVVLRTGWLAVGFVDRRSGGMVVAVDEMSYRRVCEHY